MYHLVYLTTNLVNNKIYVGKHSTWKLEDGYLGSGISLQNAINKYGKHNFKRNILYYCLSEQEAFDIESNIVCSEFVKRKTTYNQISGGAGGDKIHCSRSPITKQHKDNISLGLKEFYANPSKSKNARNIISKARTGIKLKEQTKNKISKSLQGTQRAAKIWILQSPNDTIFHTTCLKEFCKTHNLNWKALSRHEIGYTIKSGKVKGWTILDSSYPVF
jgi:hypothetical protein